MKLFAIKLSTGENAPLNTYQEVMDVINLRNKLLEKNKMKTIPLAIDGAIAHIFPENIVGWIEFKGTPLETIVEEQESLHASEDISLADAISTFVEESTTDATVD